MTRKAWLFFVLATAGYFLSLSGHTQDGVWGTRGSAGKSFGQTGDLPDPAAYRDAGIADAAVFRPERPTASSGETAHFDLLAYHVRYKLGLFKWEENPDFDFWREAGAKEACRERIWISEVWKPEPNEIRNVVLIAAGQQGAQYTWSAEANITTGQSEDWRCGKKALTCAIPIRRRSVAGLIYEDGVDNDGGLYRFSPHDTLFVLVFDAAFYYGLNQSNKQNLEDGYYNYLIDRIGPSPANVQTIFMVGSSRGGALVFRLAKRFMDGSSPLRDAKILLGTLDGVAHQGQGECGTSTSTVTNPLNSSYRAYQARLSDFFGNPTSEQLGIYQVVGGARVVSVDVFYEARAFINHGAPTFDYSFDWVDRAHVEIGRVWQDDCAGALLNWLAEQRSSPEKPSKAPWITDYSGTGTSDIAVFRPASGLWAVRGLTRAYFGTSGDVPVPGDYTGDGTTEIACFRPSSALWAIRGLTRVYFGADGDIPVPGYYDGTGASVGIYRPDSGLWAIRGVTRMNFGSASDTPVPGDYDGDGKWSPAVFRPDSGLWTIRGLTRVYFGVDGDIPVPGVFTGDSLDRIGIFRPDFGLWAVRGVTRAYFGAESDLPVIR